VLEGALDQLHGQPYVADIRTMDIPATVAACIRNAPEGLVAISLRPYGAGMIAAAERAARRRGVRVIWLPIGAAVRGPPESDLLPSSPAGIAAPSPEAAALPAPSEGGS